MRRNHSFILGTLGTLMLSLAAVQAQAAAHGEDAPYNVPPNGAVNFNDLTLLGEDIGAALRKRTNASPMHEYLGNTFTCSASGLWECHIWFAADGSGALFHARKLGDGTLELGSAEFKYRVAGKVGDYHLCVRLTGETTEHCARQKWDESHYLYDEWFDNHDQPAERRTPAYRSVHEQYAIIPGHR